MKNNQVCKYIIFIIITTALANILGDDTSVTSDNYKWKVVISIQ